MDIKELLVDSLMQQGPKIHVQYINSKNRIYAVYLELSNYTLTIKDVACITDKRSKASPSTKAPKPQKEEAPVAKVENVEAPRGSEILPSDDEFSFDLNYPPKTPTSDASCQTEALAKFDKWTSQEKAMTRHIGEQTDIVPINSLGIQTSDENQESRCIQVEFCVVARANQTDFDTHDKNEQTDFAADAKGSLQYNTLLADLVKQLTDSVNDRNFIVNLDSIGNTLQLPMLLKELEATGAKAFLEQKRWGLKKFRLWTKHRRYLHPYKTRKVVSRRAVVQSHRPTTHEASQTESVSSRNSEIQTEMKKNKWYNFL